VREWLRRRLGIVVVVAVVLVFTSANRVASFLTDLWWFDNLGYREVFTTILTTRVLLGLVFGALLAVMVAVNLHVVRRIRPLFIPSTPQQAAVERYRQMADPYLPWLIAAVALVFGATAGLAVSVEWEPFLLWQNSTPFGVADPQFGRDIAFYVFELPFLKFVQTWLFTSLLLTTMLTVGAHYLLGGIRPENPGEKVMPNVKVHLSILLALLLAARGWGYWLDRFLLNYSPRGQVTGASYTDVNAELPALNLLLVVTVIAIGLVLYNIRRRGFLLPGAALGLLVLASILLQGAYPAIIQRLRVDPQELAREAPFIERNLEFTRAAYDIAGVELQQFEVENDLDQAQAAENEITLNNVRLWDPETLSTTYAQLQALRPYYRFNDVDVDRYVVDGELRQIMLSTRELSLQGIPSQAQTWQNQTLTFTHGYGVVASLVNTANSEGQPVFVARDIPPRGADELVPQEQAAIYYGEDLNPPYSIVDTDNPEIDYEEPGTQRQVTTSYAGAGGVALDSLSRRVAFALRFSDPNILLSDLFTPESRILFQRDVQDRVRAVAPYLSLDDDPYAVVIEGRVLWVQDAYTSSAFYPYSERETLPVSGRPTVNYVRNSVKAVVDAYDGTVELVVVDEQDPVLQAWRQAFPDLYVSLDDMPDGLMEHFRYPQDLFELQSRVYTTYHIPGVEAFYSKADEWEIPRDPSRLENEPGRDPGATPLDPYYLLMRLPGETDEEFVLIQPYLAANKPNMIAWLAARSDPDRYGELFAVQFPSDQTILGPQQVQARLEQEDEISAYITLRSQAGSEVIRGNLLVLPIEQSILYVEPLFLQSPQAEIPELARVVLVMGDRVVFERTLAEAVAALVGAEPPEDVEPPDEGGGGQPDGGTDGIAIDQLLVEALERFAEAQDALADGNLGEYQRLIEEAQDLVERAAEEEGLPTEEETPSEAPSPAPSPTADEG
jgi:uncharacterized membrane protein (UPF0182 family)